ncbi:hypothetical protein ACFL6U_00820 [Planctomycetota bacterium]
MLICLTPTGTVQWARTYTGLDTLSPPNVMSTRDGSLFLEAFDSQMSGDTSFELSSILIRLNAGGSPLWGKRFLDVSLGGLTLMPNGDFLSSGNTVDAQGRNAESVFVTVDGNGTLKKQVLVSAGPSTLGFAALGDNRLWYTLMLSEQTMTNPEPVQTIVIGSSFRIMSRK